MSIMKTPLLLMAVVTILGKVGADCSGAYQNGHTIYSEGSGGTSVYSNRGTFIDTSKQCCTFNKSHTLKLTIKHVIITGILGANVTCHAGGVGNYYIEYLLEGPSGKGRVIDIYADWIGKAQKVPSYSAACYWKACDW